MLTELTSTSCSQSSAESMLQSRSGSRITFPTLFNFDSPFLPNYPCQTLLTLSSIAVSCPPFRANIEYYQKAGTCNFETSAYAKQLDPSLREQSRQCSKKVDSLPKKHGRSKLTYNIIFSKNRYKQHQIELH